MKTVIISFIILLLAFKINNSYAQLSLKNPQVCHNSKRQLVCYNDGTYIIHFSNKTFSGFTTSDSVFRYNEKEKLFTVNTMQGLNPVTLQLMPLSVQIKSGDSIINITKQSPPGIIINTSGLLLNIDTSGETKIIQFDYGGKHGYLEVMPWYKKWVWDVFVTSNFNQFGIRYNYFVHSRPEFIYIRNDSLRYGMVIATSFKSAKRVWMMHSSYVDTMTINGVLSKGDIPLSPYYYYEYNCFGRLKKRIPEKINICNCNEAAPVINNTTTYNEINTMKLEKLIYHSSRCFGTCPQIDMEIDSNRHILVHREFYYADKSKQTSGNFDGTLDEPVFDSLLIKLKESNYNTLEFPDVQCCDGIITTLIIYSNGQRKYFKSMMPPEGAFNLIKFLHTLGKNINLPATNTEIKLEE